jgi:hypothetical protein
LREIITVEPELKTVEWLPLRYCFYLWDLDLLRSMKTEGGSVFCLTIKYRAVLVCSPTGWPEYAYVCKCSNTKLTTIHMSEIAERM